MGRQLKRGRFEQQTIAEILDRLSELAPDLYLINRLAEVEAELRQALSKLERSELTLQAVVKERDQALSRKI